MGADLPNGVDWSILLRPRELFATIEAYNCTSYTFIITAILQCLILIYLLMKSIFHPIFTGDDQQLALHIEANYYFPRVLESYPNCHSLYKLNLSICSYSFLLRAKNLYNLTTNAIRNKDFYRRIGIAQVDVGSLVAPNCTLRQWLEMVAKGLQHRRECRNDLNELRNHLQMRKCSIHHEYGSNSEAYKLNKMYNLNLIDFEKCYDKHKQHFDDKNVSHFFRDEHHSTPIFRLDFYHWAVLTLAYISCTLLIVIISIGALVSVIYIEIVAAMRENGLIPKKNSDIISYLPNYFAESWRIIRMIDAFLVGAIQIPSLFDAQLFAWSAVTIWSRARKLYDILVEIRIYCALNVHDNQLASAQMDSHVVASRIRFLKLFGSDQTYVRRTDDDESPLLSHGRLAKLKQLKPDLDKKVTDLMKLISHLHCELVEFKRQYSTYLSMLFVYAPLCVAYCSSLMLGTSHRSIYLCLIITELCAGLPAGFGLLYSVMIERQVSIKSSLSLSLPVSTLSCFEFI